MNDIALATFSNFDAGKHASERSQPERFYHGFVLGLLVEVRDLYEVRSNQGKWVWKIRCDSNSQKFGSRCYDSGI